MALQGFDSLAVQVPSAQTRSTNVSRTSASGSSRLNARPVPAARFDSSVFPVDPPQIAPSLPPPRVAPAVVPSLAASAYSSPLVPTPRTTNQPVASSGPNYNISLTPNAAPPPFASPAANVSTASPWPSSVSAQAPALVPLKPPPPGFSSGVLQPDSRPAWKPVTSKTADWGDFDPLK